MTSADGATALLPAGFEALEPFVESWAVSGSANRTRRRDESEPAEKSAFYLAAKDLARPALDYLDTRPLDALDPPDRRLMDLMLSLAHVLLAVEVQGTSETLQARNRSRLPIATTPADQPAAARQSPG